MNLPNKRIDMDKQQDKKQQTEPPEKPLYRKPEVIATYSKEDMERAFGHAYGQSTVDLFGP
jgi:hypothetical protein